MKYGNKKQIKKIDSFQIQVCFIPVALFRHSGSGLHLPGDIVLRIKNNRHAIICVAVILLYLLYRLIIFEFRG